jgi:hypothetical protein
MDNVLLSPITLPELIKSFENIINTALKKKQREEIAEKLLSPADTCLIFQPSISKVTLASWTDHGLLKAYRMGGRVYYKHSEVIEAAKELKKYNRLPH